MDKSVIEQLKKRFPGLETYAIGTNSIATSAMLKAGATYGATGENPVIVNAQDADIIIGPIGIVMANSLLGEITPAMATAIGISKAYYDTGFPQSMQSLHCRLPEQYLIWIISIWYVMK